MIRFAPLALALAAAVPAVAAPAPNVVAASYADLDLATPTGAAQLQARIERAAKQVCGTADIRDLTAMSEMEKCRTVALNEAAPKVQTALAAARGEQGYAANAVARHAQH